MTFSALTFLSKKSRIVTTNINDAVQHLFLLAARCCYQQGTKYSLAQSLEYLDKVSVNNYMDPFLQRIYTFLNVYICVLVWMYLTDCGIHLRSKGCLVYLQLTEDTEETLVLRAYIMLSLGDSDELKVKKKTQLLSFIIEI